MLLFPMHRDAFLIKTNLVAASPITRDIQPQSNQIPIKKDPSSKGTSLLVLPPYLPPGLQAVDGDFAASQSAGGPWSTVALVPWTFNGVEPSQPSSVLDSVGTSIGLQLRGPFVLLLRVPAHTKPGSLCPAGRLLLPFIAFKHIRLSYSEYRVGENLLSSFRG